MTTPLASDRITLAHGDSTVRLRPSLRAALHLQRKHGLARLCTAVAQQHVGIILSIVDIATDGNPAAAEIIRATLADNGVIGLVDHRAALESFIAQSFGLDNEPAEDQRPAGRHVPIEQALLDLYEIGAGWCGWTPADTWNSTPAEIVSAQRGLVSKLQAIHGSADDQPQDKPHDPRDLPSQAEVKAGIAELRALTGKAA